MTTNGTPPDETSVDLKDATNWAADIVNTAINMRAHTRLSGAALRLWDAAVPLFETECWSGQHRQAVKLSLDALIMQPDVLAWVAREARDHLAKVEAAETTPVPTKTSWLQDGQKALAVIRALEAGTPGDDTMPMCAPMARRQWCLATMGNCGPWTRTRAPAKHLARLRSETLLRSAVSTTSFGRLHGLKWSSWR